MTLQGITRFMRALGFFGGVLSVVLVLSPVLQCQSFSIQTLKTASAPEDVIAVDLNHDSLPDLVVLHRKAALISIYLNLGNGKFAAPITYPTAPGPISLDAANAGGNLDLIVGSSKMAAFSVYQGNGNGSFLPHRDYFVPGWSGSTSVTGNRGFFGDPNATNVLNLTLDNQLSMSFNGGSPGDETFCCGWDYKWTGPGNLTQGLLADFDNDGETDVLFGVCCSGGPVPTTTLYLMRAATFSPQPFAQVAVDNQVLSLVAGDIRQDGNMGFMATFRACAGSGCQGVLLFTGLGDGTFRQITLEVPTSAFDVPRSPRLIDYDGDGLNDVAVLAHRRTGTGAPHDSVLIWTAKTDGTYKPFVEINLGTNGLDTTNDAKSLFAADLYRRGRLDLVVANPKGNSLTILTNQSQQQSSFPQCQPRTDGASIVLCGPVDGATVNATHIELSGVTSGTVEPNNPAIYIDGAFLGNGVGLISNFNHTPLGKGVLMANALTTTGQTVQTVRHLTLYNPYLETCSPGATETVNFCLPARDGSVTSPVRVMATGSSNNVVTATNIYIDNVLKFVGGMFVDKSFSLSNGSHRIVAKSWNRDGGNFYAVRLVNVTSQGCPLVPSTGVNVCQPASGATVSSPIHFQASANSDHPITGWMLYVPPDSNIFGSFDTQLSTDLVLPKGKQTVQVKAWDSSGRIVGIVNRTITVQ
jgi:hypothetical protein